jgi:hypothetical protein
MTDDVDIGLLSTRIRSSDAEHAQALAGQVRQLAGQQLARALDGAGDRALARARLPAGAVVAVQRLDLQIKVSADLPAGALAAGWAAAFEAGLARLLATIPPGDADEDAPAAWFADAWAAERRHLERRATGQPDAWWTLDLAGDDDSPDPLAPVAVLLRWLAREPARAVATMAALARADARVAALLTPDEAARLTQQLIGHFACPEAPPAWPATASPAAAGTPPQPATSVGVTDHLAHDRRRLTVTASAAQAAPWLAALLLAAHPSATRLPAATLWQLIATASQPASPAGPAPAATHATAPSPSATSGSAQAGITPDEAPAASHLVHAAGLLLLLRPLVRPGLLPAAEHLGPALGDLALTALRRVLAALPAGERAVAEERERPLLAVFAPECDWRERIALIPVRDPATASHLLDTLTDAIPTHVAPAPGALRQVFGTTPAAFPSAADSRLAALLLRPGKLRASAWDAELAWPLAAIDLALRRAGWDQDPGWLPWLGRTIRFRFGASE